MLDIPVCFGCEVSDPEILLNYQPQFCCEACRIDYYAEMPLVRFLERRKQQRRREQEK